MLVLEECKNALFPLITDKIHIWAAYFRKWWMSIFYLSVTIDMELAHQIECSYWVHKEKRMIVIVFPYSNKIMFIHTNYKNHKAILIITFYSLNKYWSQHSSYTETHLHQHEFQPIFSMLCFLSIYFKYTWKQFSATK